MLPILVLAPVVGSIQDAAISRSEAGTPALTAAPAQTASNLIETVVPLLR
jgi:hypothetical protein